MRIITLIRFEHVDHGSFEIRYSPRKPRLADSKSAEVDDFVSFFSGRKRPEQTSS